MEQFTSELQEQLQVATAFTIPIFGGIQIAESTVITWVIMACLAAPYTSGRILRFGIRANDSRSRR